MMYMKRSYPDLAIISILELLSYHIQTLHTESGELGVHTRSLTMFWINGYVACLGRLT